MRLIPFIIIFGTMLLSITVTGWIFYLIVRRYFDNEQKIKLLQEGEISKREMAQVSAPLRLQAYERMALFLERISPDSLILRCYRPSMRKDELQMQLTKTIREEWEHNLSQQVYVSHELWLAIRAAKDEMINKVNSASVSVGESGDAQALAAAVFVANGEANLVEQTIEQLTDECQRLLS